MRTENSVPDGNETSRDVGAGGAGGAAGATATGTGAGALGAGTGAGAAAGAGTGAGTGTGTVFAGASGFAAGVFFADACIFGVSATAAGAGSAAVEFWESDAVATAFSSDDSVLAGFSDLPEQDATRNDARTITVSSL